MKISQVLTELRKQETMLSKIFRLKIDVEHPFTQEKIAEMLEETRVLIEKFESPVKVINLESETKRIVIKGNELQKLRDAINGTKKQKKPVAYNNHEPVTVKRKLDHFILRLSL